MALPVALGQRDPLEIVGWMAAMDFLGPKERRVLQATLDSLVQLDYL